MSAAFSAMIILYRRSSMGTSAAIVASRFTSDATCAAGAAQRAVSPTVTAWNPACSPGRLPGTHPPG